MRYLKQLIYDMRHQKMMTWISISGTAVSVFLVMVLFMADKLKTVEIAPDNNRQRIYAGMNIDIQSTAEDSHWTMMGGLSYDAAKRLFGDVEGVEMVSYINSYASLSDVLRKGEVPIGVSTKNVDGNFWKLFDFKFLHGQPFTEDECMGNTDKVVLTRSVAHKLFSTEEAVGHELNIGGKIYVVGGVVEDVNPILQNAWSEIYLPLDAGSRESWSGGRMSNALFGSVMALMLYAEDTDPEAVRREVKSRYATLNAELAKEDAEVIYKNVPYSPEEVYLLVDEEQPDLAKDRKRQWFLYAVLILLPAINLSSLMRGRMRHRVSELGVRRAFGAKRSDIIRQLLGENLVVTVAGGVIGYILSYLFMLMLSSEFFFFVTDSRVDGLEVRMATPSFNMLFTWGAFFVAVGACLLLNILTATVPAWRAALINPAEAISKSRN